MKKLIATVIFALLVCGLFTGCADTHKTEDFTPPETISTGDNTTDTNEGTEDDLTSAGKEESVQSVQNTDTVVSHADASLSDDLFDYSFELDGRVYSLPFAYADLAAGGWTVRDADEMISSMHVNLSDLVKSGKASAYIMTANPYRSEKALADCRVVGFSIDCFALSTGEDHSFSLGKGIDFDSTENDVRAAFGEPSREYDGTSSRTLYYEETDNAQHCVEFTFDSETGAMYMFSLKNIIVEDLPDDSSAVAVEAAAAYTAPASIGDSYDTFAFMLFDDIYSMPAPISYYIEKGWEPVNFSADDTVNGSDSGYGLKLRRNGKTMTVCYENLSKNVCAASDCFVTEFTVGGSFYGEIPITLGGGITVGSDIQDAIDAWGNPDSSESASGYTTTVFGQYGSRVCLSSDDSTGKILNITVQNY